MYIFSPKVLALIKKGQRLDATDLLALAIAKGMKVTYFPVEGTWIDFRQAGELMRHVNAINS